MSRSKQDGDGAKSSEGHAACYDVYRVGVRVPPFYPEKPGLWFAQLESQFVLANITTDATKFHYEMGNLDPVYASEVEDIITAPATSNRYEKLKSELVKRLSASREKKVQQLLTHEELGDRKPSQFLRHLQHLAGPDVPVEFLRTIWTSRLPSSTQTIIASQAKATLEEVAELADRIHNVVIPPSPHTVAATSMSSTPPGSSEGKLTSEIAELTRQVQALTSQVNRLSRQRSRSNNYGGRSPSRRSQSSYRKFPICWYHSKFQDKATKCVKPCDHKGKA